MGKKGELTSWMRQLKLTRLRETFVSCLDIVVWVDFMLPIALMVG